MKTGERFIPYRQFRSVLIPLSLVRCAGVSHGAKLCWGVLAYHAGERGDCYPLQETIANELGVSVESVKRYLVELRDQRLIEIETHGHGRVHQNHYYFLWHELFDDGSKMTSRQTDDDRLDSTPRDTTTRQIRPARQVKNDSRDRSDSTPPIKEEEIQLRDSVKRSTTAVATLRIPTVAQSEYPLTEGAVRSVFSTADSTLVVRIVQLALQAYLSVERPQIPEPTDADIADAVEVAVAESPKQTSAGLFKTTVPKVVESWARFGKHNTRNRVKFTPTRSDIEIMRAKNAMEFFEKARHKTNV
jgi:hypothetical protein